MALAAARSRSLGLASIARELCDQAVQPHHLISRVGQISGS
jgi:hypothetical protein